MRIVRVTLFVIAICIFACSTIVRAELVDVGVHRGDAPANYSPNPFVAFERAASVYIGTVKKIASETKLEAQAGVDVNRNALTDGLVTLQISNVLRGEKAESITLYYHYLRMGGPRRGSSNFASLDEVWPRIEELPANQPLLFVVIPGPFRSSTLAGDAFAACAVYPISGPDDPMVRSYRQMIALHELKGPALVEAATKAAQQPEPILRRYLASTAHYRLQRPDGIALLAAITSIYLKPKFPNDLIGFDEIGYIVDREGVGDITRVRAIRTLQSLLNSSSDRVRNEALAKLVTAVNQMRTSDRYFSARERAQILADVTRAKNSTSHSESAAPIEAWLAAPPGVLALPARGSPYLFKTDSYYAFHHGAAIYVAQVKDRHQSSGPDPATTEWMTPQDNHWPLYSGKVDLKITATLQGDKFQSQTLEYSYHQFSNNDDDWPNLYKLPKDRQLLCVVMSTAGFAQGLQLPAPGDVKFSGDFIAVNVFPVSGPDDPLVKAFARLLTWDSLEGDALKQALLQTPDVGQLPRFYLILTAMERLPQADAIDVLTALARSMGALPTSKEGGGFIDGAVLTCLDILLGPSTTSDPALQAKVIQTLADMTTAQDLSLKFSAISHLGTLSQEAPDGARSLSAEQKANVRAAIDGMANSLRAEQKSQVLEWLDRKSI